MRFSFLIVNQIRDYCGVVIGEYLTFLIDKIWFDLQDKQLFENYPVFYIGEI